MNSIQGRLSVFVPDMTVGGAERAAFHLVQGMARRGYDIDLVLGDAVGDFMADIPKSVRVIDFKTSRVSLSLPALVRYLRRERPQAILSVMSHTNIITLWARRLAGVLTRVVVNEQNTLSRVAHHASSQSGRMMPRLIRRFYPWADGIVAVSNGVADDLAQVIGLPREQIQVIYNPMVTPELREKARAPLDHAWFKSGEPPVVLAVGRLAKQKDYPTLIQAFSNVRQARSARLLILGRGDERPALEALVNDFGLEQDVSLHGFVDNPYPYMAHASAFVLSSKWEGLPGVLIEALYCGAPLIATDCPSGTREILANGKYGRLVPVGDIAALAQAIEATLAENPSGPPPESWQPFELERVMNQYIRTLVGT